MTRKSAVLTCDAWDAVISLFEVSQLVSSCVAVGETPWVPLMLFWCAFVNNGTFDSLDILFVFLGATLAYLTLGVALHRG